MSEQLALFGAAEPAPAFAPNASGLLAQLDAWVRAGWIRRLDVALARFVAGLCPDASAQVLLAVALTAHLEGRGHVCLPLDELRADPQALLGWDADAMLEVRDLLRSLDGSWAGQLRSCTAVCADESEPAPMQPLVLRGERLYLRRYWLFEQRVAAQVRERSAPAMPTDAHALRRWLDLLFPPTPAEGRVDWQKIACAVALHGRLSVITGGPGTGKTYTAARLLALLFATADQPERLRIALAAPTGKAAARLRQSIESSLGALQAQLGDTLPLEQLAAHIAPARTLHALLGARPDTRRFARDAGHPLDVDVLLVDEASMVHLEMMAALLDAVPPDARVILLGDKDQLASVEAGAVLGDLCRDAEAGRYHAQTVAEIEAAAGQRIPVSMQDESGPRIAQHTVMLRHSQRFGGAIGALAAAINAGDAARACELLDAPADTALCWLPDATPAAVLSLISAGRAGAEGGHAGYLEAIRSRPADPSPDVQQAWIRRVLSAFDRFRVLCAVREGEWGVVGLNRAIERRLADERRISPRGEWYEGRPVMVTRNDARLGVFNGDVGVVLRVAPGEAALRAYFVDGEQLRSVSVARLADVETAFAMTVHKSQGSEFDHTVLVLPPQAGGVTRELIYTGVTRARSALTLVSASREALADGIARATQRSSGLSASV